MAFSYFAYGINMDREHFTRLCPDAVLASSAFLAEHRFMINLR